MFWKKEEVQPVEEGFANSHRCPLSRFPAFFSFYIDDWLKNEAPESLKGDKVDAAQAFANYTGLSRDAIVDLTHTPTLNIPREVMQKMGLAIRIVKVPKTEYVDDIVVIRDDRLKDLAE